MKQTKTRRNVTIDEDTHQALKDLGNGNVSKGVRKAVEIATSTPKQPNPHQHKGTT